MKDLNIINLYPHNMESYEKIKKHNEEYNITSIIHATGTGKTYLGVKLAYDNKDKKTLYIVPTQTIKEHIIEIIEENPHLNFERDFPNLKLITYQSLINLSYEELAHLDVDLLILDEFHHLGGPVWGKIIKVLIETHPNLKVFGMTAYAVRDRGTSYERDMTNPETEEIFSNTVCSRYDLCDAIIDGVLPKFIYRSAYVILEKELETINKLKNKNVRYKNNEELTRVLKDIKKRIHESNGAKAIFQKYIKTNGKYIYFCPLNGVAGKSNIVTIMNEVKTWLKEMGLTEDEYELYSTTNTMKELGKKNRKAFYNNENLKGESVKNKLRIMFAINQYNEGVHAPGVNGVIMGRETHSDIVFFEQLGRGLAINGQNKEEYDKLMQKSYEELVVLCQEKNLKVNEGASKEDLASAILAPVILDFAGNISFVKQLENNIRERVKEIKNNKLYCSREIHFTNMTFDVEMINEDIFQILMDMKKRLAMTWMDYYNLAKTYNEHYENCEILQKFKTKDGIHYDETGVALGTWLYSQRKAYKEGKMNFERINLLEAINVRLETKDYESSWQQNYNLAKTYYEHYGDCEISQKFKTKDGVNYDETGIALGTWLYSQRKAYKEGKMNFERINLLEAINVRLETKDYESSWQQNYNLAKTYYEHYGDCEISQKFKTKDGVNYDETGIALAKWLDIQRKAYKEGKMNFERINLLKAINVRLEIKDDEAIWQQNYNLAKTYYEHYGHCEIPQKFKTKDGIHYDETGVSLGVWLNTQRRAHKKGKMNFERISLLEAINVRLETRDWQQNYNLAKTYYEHYGHCKIPKEFKTKDGIHYDETGIALGMWLDTQRKAHKKGKMNFERISLLEAINVRLETRDWQQNYNLAKAYYEHYGHCKIPTKFKTKDGIHYDETGVALGTWLNNQRKAYKGKSDISLERISLLDKIGMTWFLKNTDAKLQNEEITEKNTLIKQKEILHRVWTCINSFPNDSFPTKEEMNKEMIKQLTINAK